MRAASQKTNFLTLKVKNSIVFLPLRSKKQEKWAVKVFKRLLQIHKAGQKSFFLLRAIIDYYNLDLSIYFWRTTSGFEVDFIVYGEPGLFAFELKSKAYIDRKDYSALKAFKTDYPMARCYLIYSGDHAEQQGEMTALPIKEVLLKLPEILQAKKF